MIFTFFGFRNNWIGLTENVLHVMVLSRRSVTKTYFINANMKNSLWSEPLKNLLFCIRKRKWNLKIEGSCTKFSISSKVLLKWFKSHFLKLLKNAKNRPNFDWIMFAKTLINLCGKRAKLFNIVLIEKRSNSQSWRNSWKKLNFLQLYLFAQNFLWCNLFL